MDQNHPTSFTPLNPNIVHLARPLARAVARGEAAASDAFSELSRQVAAAASDEASVPSISRAWFDAEIRRQAGDEYRNTPAPPRREFVLRTVRASAGADGLLALATVQDKSSGQVLASVAELDDPVNAWVIAIELAIASLNGNPVHISVPAASSELVRTIRLRLRGMCVSITPRGGRA